MAYLRPFFSALQKKMETPRRSGLGMGCRTRMQNFRVYLSKTAWPFGLSFVKMNKTRYLLQIGFSVDPVFSPDSAWAIFLQSDLCLENGLIWLKPKSGFLPQSKKSVLDSTKKSVFD